MIDPERWAEFGPGDVGSAWDLTVLGLGWHLRGQSIEDPVARLAWLESAEANEFMTRSSGAWGTTLGAAGATTTEVAPAVESRRTLPRR